MSDKMKPVNFGKWTDVASSNIVAIRYSEEFKFLLVRFKAKGGYSEYAYPGVDPEVYKGLLESTSKGKYLHAAIKPSFDAVKVPTNPLDLSVQEELERRMILFNRGVVMTTEDAFLPQRHILQEKGSKDATGMLACFRVVVVDDKEEGDDLTEIVSDCLPSATAAMRLVAIHTSDVGCKDMLWSPMKSKEEGKWTKTPVAVSYRAVLCVEHELNKPMGDV